MAKKGKNNSDNHIGPWKAVLEIGLKLVDRGQILGGFLGLILLVVTWRLPPEELAWTVRFILQNLRDFSFVGYAGWGVSMLGWGIHYRAKKRLHMREVKRLAGEKVELQKRLERNNSKRN